MAAPNTGLDGMLLALGICGCNANLIDAITDEDVSSMDDLTILTGKDIKTLAKTISSLPKNRGGCKIGITKIKKVQALCHWCKMQRAGSLPPDANLWDAAALTKSLQELELEDARQDNDHEKKIPSNLDALSWVSWERSMRNYLTQLPSNVAGVPLVYVIRKLITPNYRFIDDDERCIYSLSFQGLGFQQDNKKVYIILKQILVEGPAWPWISGMDRTQNSRGAWISLVQHYDGPGEKERRIALATEQIKSLHYKDERTFTFEMFITKLKLAYKVLADNGIPKAEREKVSEMCEQINSSNLAV